jgi:hypothetical protein
MSAPPRQLSNLRAYRSARSRNQRSYLTNYPHFIEAFVRIDRNFAILAGHLHNSDAPLLDEALILALLVAQRYTTISFDCLSSYQADQGWINLRPAVEIVLMAGKWLDDPGHLSVWLNHSRDKKKYRQTFLTPAPTHALESQSLPRSHEICAVLMTINDKFLHPNPALLAPQLEPKRNPPELNTFDRTSPRTVVNFLAWIHFVGVVQTSFQEMLANTLDKATPLDLTVEEIEALFSVLVAEIGGHDGEPRVHLCELGLWPVR